MTKTINYIVIGTIITLLIISTVPLANTNATEEIIYDKDADLPICVYKVIKDCKTKSGLICIVDTTIDPCQDIFHGFTGMGRYDRPVPPRSFIVPDDNDEWIEMRNSDDSIVNDIPPDDDEGYFCDHPSNPGSCYDRNDNPESFCVSNPQYAKFCEIIGPICDDEGGMGSTDPECTDQDEDCPKNYVRYNEYCASYRVDCDASSSNVYCSGQRRADGLLRCDEPNHPGYRFCEELNN